VSAIDEVRDQAQGEDRRAPELDGAAADLARALSPGTLALRNGKPESADPRALELLGLADAAALAAAAAAIAAALSRRGPDGGRPAALPLGPGGRPLLAEVRPSSGAGAPGEVALLFDPAALAALAADVQQARHLRAVTHISPAVAHDLRAPINAMVFNLEILKETIAAGKGAEPAGRERQLRYVTVLRDELARLHRELEIFLAQTSGRGDRGEEVDLREAAGELVALLAPPARKLQVQVSSELTEEPVTIAANRWRLRQALLQVGIAALARVGHPGRLLVALSVAGGRARLTLAGPAGAPEAAPTAPATEDAPEPSFDLRLAAPPDGEGAQPLDLYVAREILAAQGGELKPLAAGGDVGLEIEWPVSAVSAARSQE
jgi:signal transduction histidine kinase